MSSLSEYKINMIDKNSPEYPQLLKNISDPPERLYYAGDVSLLNSDCVAVVGSRKYTVYGKSVAAVLGRRLGEAGLTVVSGLAYGIDAFSHEGTLEGKGKCIAVLGSGIRMMTPRSNYKLMMRLLDEGGLVVSEYEPGFSAQPWTFPQRNRIISGLSRCICVVEANFNSGALITAQCANEQGRTVYAVPGNINSQFSMGSNLLIRDGAVPLVVIDDVIREMGHISVNDAENEMHLGEDETKVMDVIKQYGGVTPDAVAVRLGMTVSKLNSIVTVLEIKGAVELYAGKIHAAK